MTHDRHTRHDHKDFGDRRAAAKPTLRRSKRPILPEPVRMSPPGLPAGQAVAIPARRASPLGAWLLLALVAGAMPHVLRGIVGAAESGRPRRDGATRLGGSHGEVPTEPGGLLDRQM
jgi:hypothetical protein